MLLNVIFKMHIVKILYTMRFWCECHLVRY